MAGRRLRTSTLPLTLVAAVALGTVLATPAAPAPPEGDNGPIVYMRVGDDGARLRKLTVDGAGTVLSDDELPTAAGDHSETSPAVGPDGRLLWARFPTPPSPGPPSVFVADLDGDDEAEVVANGTDPVWLPDASGFVFRRSGDVWLHRFGSGAAEQLTDGLTILDVDVLPVGPPALALSTNPSDGVFELVEQPLGPGFGPCDPSGGSCDPEVLHSSDSPFGDLAVNAIGQWWYFGCRVDGAGQLCRLPRAGGAPEVLTDLDSAPDFPAPSPDGTRVVFARDTGSGKLELALLQLGDGTITPLAQGGLPVEGQAASWGADGEPPTDPPPSDPPPSDPPPSDPPPSDPPPSDPPPSDPPRSDPPPSDDGPGPQPVTQPTETACGAADLHVDKVPDRDDILVNQTVTWTITVTNNGPSTACDVIVEDHHPDVPVAGVTFDVLSSDERCFFGEGPRVTAPVKCRLGDLPPNQRVTIALVFQYDYRARLASDAATEVTNRVRTYATGSADPDTRDNAAEQAIVVRSAADLRFGYNQGEFALRPQVILGSRERITLTVHNTGGLIARDTRLTIAWLGDNATFLSASARMDDQTARCELRFRGAEVVCDLGDVGISAIWKITLTFEARDGTQPITVAARLRSPTLEATPADNAFEDTAVVVREQDVGLRCGSDTNDRVARVKAADDPSELSKVRDAHAGNVACLLDRFIAVGTQPDGEQLFEPVADVRRGQMATLVVNTLTELGLDDLLPAGGGRDEFVDIADSVHRTNINRLARAGVLAGTGDRRFSPGSGLERQQLATVLVQVARLVAPVDPAFGDHFADVVVGSDHHDSINAGFEEGLFSGVQTPTPGEPRSGRFAPATVVKRDQFASFIVHLAAHLHIAYAV